MSVKNGLRLVSLFICCALTASCAAGPTKVAPTSSAAASPPAGVAAASPAPSPAASLSPSMSPSPTPPPAASPSPTPARTPDPWAQFFSAEGAYVSIEDPDKGPWIYMDKTLYVRVDLVTAGNRKYCRAEIYTRGPLPFGGFAYKDRTGGSRALPYLIGRQYKAILGITGDFVTHHGNPKGVMIRQGILFHDKKQAPTLAVLPDGELRAYEPGETNYKKLKALGVKDSFAFGPILVKDGKVHDSVYTHPLRPGNWRAAIGMVEKRHYVCIVTISGFTLAETAKLFVQNKCSVAYNLDGGHSASMVFMGEQLYRGGRGSDNLPQRPLPDILMFGYSAAVPGPKDPVYCDGVSKNERYRPKPTDRLIN